MDSEFGKGFTYCIGLFLAHAERDKEADGSQLWFYGATDHIFELVIPDNFVLKAECESWRDECRSFRYNRKYTKDDVFNAVSKAKNFLLAWDKQCGIPAEKGEWE